MGTICGGDTCSYPLILEFEKKKQKHGWKVETYPKYEAGG